MWWLVRKVLKNFLYQRTTLSLGNNLRAWDKLPQPQLPSRKSWLANETAISWRISVWRCRHCCECSHSSTGLLCEQQGWQRPALPYPVQSCECQYLTLLTFNLENVGCLISFKQNVLLYMTQEKQPHRLSILFLVKAAASHKWGF